MSGVWDVKDPVVTGHRLSVFKLNGSGVYLYKAVLLGNEVKCFVKFGSKEFEAVTEDYFSGAVVSYMVAEIIKRGMTVFRILLNI